MSRTRTSSALELLLIIDRSDPRPLHHQLEGELRAAIRTGRLAPATTLPSTRGLAGQLGVSRGIVVEAYEQLAAEGYLVSRPGGTTRVARLAIPAPPRPFVPAVARPLFDFRPGRPALDEFPRMAWLRSIRRVLDRTPSDRFGYLDGRGVPELRLAIADYVRRVRGVSLDADDVVVCTGFAQALRLVATVVRAAGLRRVALEDPSDPDYRETVRAAGLEVSAVPVDEAGLRVDRLAESRAEVVLVTAAHQYPTGGVLSADRRAGLVDWAAHRPGLVIEDDYDAEFRYDREPIGAIQGLDPARVIYAGSASKVLAPGLRLGWLAAPPALADAIAAAKLRADSGSSALDQLALADFLGRGELDRHLRRMRPIYRRRRDTLLAALARDLPTLRPTGASAGLHLLAWLPEDIDEDAVVTAALAAGIAIAGLRPRRITPAGSGGLIFGYGAVDDAGIEAGVRRLAEVIASVSARG